MRVVHCKEEPYTEYIGRPSPLGNIFSTKPSKYPTIRVDTVMEALIQYEAWLREHQHSLNYVKNLPENTVLGCFCKTKANPDALCHGDVVIRLWKELHGKL